MSNLQLPIITRDTATFYLVKDNALFKRTIVLEHEKTKEGSVKTTKISDKTDVNVFNVTKEKQNVVTCL